MLLTRSGWLKALATVVAMGAFVAIYEVTIQDSKKKDPNAPPEPGDHFSISATAYCKGSVTAAGVAAQNGVAASDKSLLPLGSIVQIRSGDVRYDGMYTILDTGPEIKGHEVDIYMWSCYDALDFGRRDVNVTLLRRGWDPRATPPQLSLMDRLLGRQPPSPPTLEAGPPSSRPAAPHRQAPATPGTPSSPTDAEAVAGDAPPASPSSSDQGTPAPTEPQVPGGAEPRPPAP